MNSASPKLLSLENISVQFAQRHILNQINLDLIQGEIVTLIGPNGAGKSTLVKVILGIIKPSQGQIIHHQKVHACYVPQRFHPSPSLPMRVIDMLNLEQADKSYQQQIIQELGLEKLLSNSVHHLSGGERQRMLLARALLKKPNLLVLDEPMQGLDIQSEEELYDYVQALPQRFGCTVLMVSHDLQWVMQGTNRVVCLNHHICCTGMPEQIQHNAEYQAIFGHKVWYQHHHDACQHPAHQHTQP
ncbi:MULTISPECIES: metal ABC transporter ATP-binding protein [unclassified Acinetobacter]|uniref:metal ABC transporter ATP-binding protein n=1 Tax=unclassified Acinetobacter TaxID=196816 RepID=UPI0035B74AD1